MDDNAFRSFELNGWQTVFGDYHEAFGELTDQATGPLLDAVLVGPKVRLLDVATGPGYVIAAASRRGARAVGLDFSTAMVDMAKTRTPSGRFCVGDAEVLPFTDGSFDAVDMNFAVLHLAHPERALAEAHRVLRSSGRFGFTAWCKPEEAVGFGIVLDAVQRHGNINVPLPPGPPFFRFSEPEECIRALLEAGFVRPEVVRIPQTWRLSSPVALFSAMQRGTVRTSGILRAQLPEALEVIGNAIRETVATYRSGRGFEVPMPAVLAIGEKL